LANLGFNPDNVAERARQLVQDLREDQSESTDGSGRDRSGGGEAGHDDDSPSGPLLSSESGDQS
jgi:hypothetical protein